MELGSVVVTNLRRCRWLIMRRSRPQNNGMTNEVEYISGVLGMVRRRSMVVNHPHRLQQSMRIQQAQAIGWIQRERKSREVGVQREERERTAIVN